MGKFALLIPASLIAITSLAASPVTGVNLLEDGGFESTAAQPQGWFRAGEQPYSVAEAVARSGKCSLHYHNNDAHRFVTCPRNISLTPGKSYTLDGWIRTENISGDGRGASIALEWRDAKGTFLGGEYSDGLKGTQPWTHISLQTAPLPSNAARCRVVCYVDKKMTGQAWWDDLRLVCPDDPPGAPPEKTGQSSPQEAAHRLGATVIIPNAGFEQTDDAGHLADWRGSDSPAYSLSDQAHQGRRALSATRDAKGSSEHCRMDIQLQPGRDYLLQAWVKTEDVKAASKGGGAAVAIEWRDSTGQYLGGTYPLGVSGTQDWKLVRAEVGQIPPEAADFRLICYLWPGATGTAWWDDVSVREVLPPLARGITTDHYANEASAGSVTIKVATNLNAYTLSATQVQATLDVLDAQEKVVATATPPSFDGDVCTFAIDATPLAPGTYKLRCRINSQADTSLRSEVECNLTRLAQNAQHFSCIDEHHRLIVDGKPFFPLGMYWHDLDEEALKKFADSPFNTLVSYSILTRKDLDLAQRMNLKVVYALNSYYFSSKFRPRWIKAVDDERPAIEKTVTEFRDHPAVIAWYNNDEIPRQQADRIAMHYHWIKALDPHRPVWSVLNTPNDVSYYLAGSDVMGTDPYPVPLRPIQMASSWSRSTATGTLGCRAIWQVVQAHNLGYYRPAQTRSRYRAPTFEEMRSMTWQSIAAGANGIFLYSWYDMFRMKDVEPVEARWADIKRLATQVHSLTPILLSVDPPAKVTSATAPSTISWRSYARGNQTYLLIVNADRVETSASLSLDQPFRSQETLLSDAAVELHHKQLKVTLPPLGVVLVRLQP